MACLEAHSDECERDMECLSGRSHRFQECGKGLQSSLECEAGLGQEFLDECVIPSRCGIVGRRACVGVNRVGKASGPCHTDVLYASGDLGDAGTDLFNSSLLIPLYKNSKGEAIRPIAVPTVFRKVYARTAIAEYRPHF